MGFPQQTQPNGVPPAPTSGRRGDRALPAQTRASPARPTPPHATGARHLFGAEPRSDWWVSPRRSAVLFVPGPQRGVLLHLHEELHVATGLLESVDEQLDALLLVEGGEHPAQLPHDLELLAREEDLLLAGARVVDVDGREDPPVRQ